VIFMFTARVIEWRGPPPYLFLPLPAEVAEEIKSVASRLTYGWGCIPATAQIGATRFTTSLFPRSGGYLLPVKVTVQRAEHVGFDDEVTATLELEPLR
jgi:nucleoid-associated protein YgaU